MKALTGMAGTVLVLVVAVSHPAIPTAIIDGFSGAATQGAGAPDSSEQGWTAIGATGTPDEIDAAKLAFHNDGSVGIRRSIAGASAKIRYNVTATRDVGERLIAVDAPPEVDYIPLEMNAVLRDNGPHARVIVTLKRVATPFGATGSETTTLARIDSDREDAPDPSLYFRTGTWLSENGARIFRLSFWRDAYFVEVQLIKSGSGGDPRLRVVTILHDVP
jgi:hypothetical protein